LADVHMSAFFPYTTLLRSDGRVEYLFVDGMSTEEFLKATGIELHQENKGDYVLSKRFSRIMRPYYATKTFDAGIGKGDDQIDIRSEEHTSELQSLRHLVCR